MVTVTVLPMRSTGTVAGARVASAEVLAGAFGVVVAAVPTAAEPHPASANAINADPASRGILLAGAGAFRARPALGVPEPDGPGSS
jgi:hypothetical protein